MKYIVIKQEFIEEARKKWGSHTVDLIFELLSEKHPDQVIQDLSFLKEFEKVECLIFLLQNKYREEI